MQWLTRMCVCAMNVLRRRRSMLKLGVKGEWMATPGTPKRLEQVETKGHLSFTFLTIFLPTVNESNINFVTQDKRIGALAFTCFPVDGGILRLPWPPRLGFRGHDKWYWPGTCLPFKPAITKIMQGRTNTWPASKHFSATCPKHIDSICSHVHKYSFALIPKITTFQLRRFWGYWKGIFHYYSGFHAAVHIQITATKRCWWTIEVDPFLLLLTLLMSSQSCCVLLLLFSSFWILMFYKLCFSLLCLRN